MSDGSLAIRPLMLGFGRNGVLDNEFAMRQIGTAESDRSVPTFSAGPYLLEFTAMYGVEYATA